MIKFGTDGWRAIISEEFTFPNVRKVAQAIANYVGKGTVIVGYDARFLADKFAEEAVKVMLANGISCLLTERDTPTPVVAWSVKDKEVRGAIMLTASHNPPEYLGIKFIPEYAGPASEEITKEIEAKIINPKSEILNKSQIQNPKFERFDPQDRYLKYLQTFIDPEIFKKSKLKIVIDPMYGSGRGYLDKLLQELGCQTIEIHEYRDVLFGGRNPEPADDNLDELKARVIFEKADLGLANDGDADRFGIVDEKGRFLDANQIFALLSLYLIEDKGYAGSLVRTIASTHMIDKIAALHKIKLHETPVGFKHIAEIMRKEKVIIGGEESGGISIDDHIPEKDGILACLLIAEMVARKKKPLSQIWEDLTKKVGNFVGGRINVDVDEESKKKIMNALGGKSPIEIGGIKVRDVNKLDGVKFTLEEGSWLLVRPSGTEPIIRVYAEADSENKVEKILGFCYNLFREKK